MKDLSYGNGEHLPSQPPTSSLRSKKKRHTAAIVTSTRAVVAFLLLRTVRQRPIRGAEKEVQRRPSADHDDQHSEARVSSSLVFGVFTITVSAVIVIAAAAAAAAAAIPPSPSSARESAGSEDSVAVVKKQSRFGKECIWLPARDVTLRSRMAVDRHCGWQRTQEAQVHALAILLLVLLVSLIVHHLVVVVVVVLVAPSWFSRAVSTSRRLGLRRRYPPPASVDVHNDIPRNGTHASSNQWRPLSLKRLNLNPWDSVFFTSLVSWERQRHWDIPLPGDIPEMRMYSSAMMFW